jgi:hypothetical protein
MAGHSSSKNGVLKDAYVPAIHAFIAPVRTWMPGTRFMLGPAKPDPSRA